MSPRTLHIDIETAPSLGYYFDLWKEGNIVRTVKSWCILSVAYRWDNEKAYHVRALPDYPNYPKRFGICSCCGQQRTFTNDKLLAADLWTLLDQADVIIAHNAKRFDLRKIRSRLLFHRFTPPSPFEVVDTLQQLRAHFGEDSNRLDAFARTHGLGAKLPHQGFKLWEDCINGVPSAWSMMKRYNIHDVRLLYATYHLIRPWMKQHPHMAILRGTKSGCPHCGKLKGQWRGPYKPNPAYDRWRCVCGKWSKGKITKSGEIELK